MSTTYLTYFSSPSLHWLFWLAQVLYITSDSSFSPSNFLSHIFSHSKGISTKRWRGEGIKRKLLVCTSATSHRQISSVCMWRSPHNCLIFMFGKHTSRVFLTQPKKLALEITSLLFQEYLWPLTSPAQHRTSPLLMGLLEQAKVISRCTNKHLHSILFWDAKLSTGQFILWVLIFPKLYLILFPKSNFINLTTPYNKIH